LNEVSNLEDYEYESDDEGIEVDGSEGNLILKKFYIFILFILNRV